LEKKNIGFGAEIKKNNIGPNEDVLQYLEPEDLLNYGLIPELIGRLPIFAVLHELDAKALLDILKKPKNALTKQYKRLFEMDDVELEFEPDALQEIVKLAKKRKTGARALRSILEDVMLELMYDIPSRSDIKHCIITKDYISKKSIPIYTYKEAKKSA